MPTKNYANGGLCGWMHAIICAIYTKTRVNFFPFKKQIVIDIADSSCYNFIRYQ